MKPVKDESVCIWMTFLGLGIPFKDSSLIIPAEVSPMNSGPRLNKRGNLYIRVDKFPVLLIYNMTYLPESLILHDSYVN